MTISTTVEDLRVLAKKRVPRMFCDDADGGAAAWSSSIGALPAIVGAAGQDIDMHVDSNFLLPGTF
jgi:hypothetical protein